MDVVDLRELQYKNKHRILNMVCCVVDVNVWMDLLEDGYDFATANETELGFCL